MKGSKARAGNGKVEPEWATRIFTWLLLGYGFEANGFFIGGVESFDGIHGELEAVEDGLADLLGVAEDAGQGRRDVDAEVDGALDELGAVELLKIVEQLGDGDGGDLVALRAATCGRGFRG